MINKNFLIVIFSIPLFMFAMDAPSNKIDIKRESFGKVINVEGINQLVCVGNSEVIFENGPSFCILDFVNNKPSFVLEKYCRFDDGGGDWHPTTDAPKQRALLWRYDGTYAQIVVYDSRSKTITSDKILLGHSAGQTWQNICFNAEKSLLMEKGLDHVVSYDYVTKKIDYDACASSILQKDYDINHSIFNASSKKRDFFCTGPRSFVIFSQTESGLQEKLRYDFDAHYSQKTSFCNPTGIRLQEDMRTNFGKGCEHNIVCSKDGSFIVGYAQEDPYSCYVFDCKAKTRNVLNDVDDLVDRQFGLERPCAMAIHPNDKVVATISAGYRRIRYWCLATGECVDKVSYYGKDMGDYLSEIGKKGKILSFSSNGKYLVAAYLKNCIIFDVLLHVRWARNERDLILTWWYLRNCGLWPKEIADLIVKSL